MFRASEVDAAVQAFVARLDNLWRGGAPNASPGPAVVHRVLADVDRVAVARSVSSATAEEASAVVLEFVPGPDCLDPLRNVLAELGYHHALTGWSPAASDRARTAIAVVPSPDLADPGPAPGEFRVLAIVCAYNEVDIIRPSVERLLAQGFDVHLIDNWSFDGTVDAVTDLRDLQRDGYGRLVIERFPEGGRSDEYEWTQLVEHVAAIASTSDYDWCIHHDVDERREPPFPGMSFRDFLWLVQHWGFNAVDHTLLEFRPTDDDFVDGSEPSEHLHHFEFMTSSVSGQQIKAWRNEGQALDLHSTGGHEILFLGRRVFPYNAILRHFPIRSQQHGDLKVFRDRKPRYKVAEMDLGWHWHYARLRRGHTFIRNRRDLIEWDPHGFYENYLVPRLSQQGILLREDSQPSERRVRAIDLARRTGLLPIYVKLRNRVAR